MSSGYFLVLYHDEHNLLDNKPFRWR